MPYKDEEKQRQYQKKWMREYRKQKREKAKERSELLKKISDELANLWVEYNKPSDKFPRYNVMLTKVPSNSIEEIETDLHMLTNDEIELAKRLENLKKIEQKFDDSLTSFIPRLKHFIIRGEVLHEMNLIRLTKCALQHELTLKTELRKEEAKVHV